MGKGVSDSEKATASLSSSSSSSPPSAPEIHTSPWQSPVPYLFGGLAAVLCIIIFSLLMLAFSYRRQRQPPISRMQMRLPIQKQNNSCLADSDVEVYEQKILVIMAGDEGPTFLATPVCAKCSSLADGYDEVLQKGDEIHGNSRQVAEKQRFDHVATTSSTTPPESEGALESHQYNL